MTTKLDNFLDDFHDWLGTRNIDVDFCLDDEAVSKYKHLSVALYRINCKPTSFISLQSNNTGKSCYIFCNTEYRELDVLLESVFKNSFEKQYNPGFGLVYNGCELNREFCKSKFMVLFDWLLTKEY